MNILDIAIAKKLAGGGGGSGTDNYNDLSNLPKINDTTLSGNKSSSALGLQSEINSDSKLASDLVDDTNQDNKFVTSTEKNTWNGKQNAIDADHKINADYVDDSTSTNKFVTASDKETWNAKQNAIDNSHKLSSDLVDDTNHTNKFVTSSEKQTWNAKQNAIDSDHKLSSSLVSFTTAEAAALASGIDSSKVVQISTNQTNILYVLGKTGKNLLSKSTLAISGSTWHDIEPIKAGSYIVTGRLPNTASNYSIDFRDENDNDVGSFAGVGWSTLYNDGMSLTLTGTATKVKIWAAGTSSGDELTTAMVCTPEDWAVGHDYAPYALPNYDLTRLEAEDRAALAEEIDAGAKNKIDVASVTLTGAGYIFNNYDPPSTLPAGTYVLSCMSSQSTAGNLQLQVYNTSLNLIADETISSKYGTNVIKFTITETAKRMHLYSNVAGTFWNLIVCTKAAFGVSKAFVPYRPNYDLVANSVWKYSELRYTNTATNEFQNTGVSFTVPANRAVEFYAYDRKDAAYLDSIVVCDSESNLSTRTTTIVSINRIESDGFTDSQYWTLQTTGIIPTYNAAVTYYVWVKRKSTGSNPVGLAYRFIT